MKAILGNRYELFGNEYPDTSMTWDSLIALYEAWNKPEQANQWRTKLPFKQPEEQ